MIPRHAHDVLGEQGPLAATLDGFTPRAGQQEMATRIEQTIADNRVFIAESGTGTGKTFAYLVPALLSGKKILISTGTKHLQEQLFHGDLPRVRAALGLPVTIALLKGRANYLCLHHLDRAQPDLRGSASLRADVARVRAWSGRTHSGDIAELSDIPEDAELWSRVTSTAENCLGSACGHFDRCWVNRARREALAADVLVVNHHLFFADLALREEGFAQLLPGVDAVIFDEAHQLAEIASQFFGLTLSSAQLAALAHDAAAEERKEESGVADLIPLTDALHKVAADFRLSLGPEPRRAPWSSALEQTAVMTAFEELKATLVRLDTLLETAAAKGQGLANCSRRAQTLLDRLFMIGENPRGYIAWFETTARGFMLHLTPMDVATPFRQQVEGANKAWVFTSATLAVNRSFAHFQAQLGLEEADTGLWDSPFDYANRTLLYLPRSLPAPSAPDYTDRVIDIAVPVLQASRGRAFLLFTSHRALKHAAALLADKLPFPLLVQGSAPRSQLLAHFRQAGNAVLLGTGSFWEGVDVRGEALSCVIIDKLPFASPDDPVLQARARELEEAGGNSFMDYQVPQAVIALKQGVGRLIRDVQDRGVLVLCDPRLLGKGYGRIFMASLPPMPRTTEFSDVQVFFAAEDGRKEQKAS